jgi:hypothetical protein
MRACPSVYARIRKATEVYQSQRKQKFGFQNVQGDLGLQLIFHVDDIGMLKLFCLRDLTVSPTGHFVKRQSMYVAASVRPLVFHTATV